MADKRHGNDELTLISAGTSIEGKITTDGSIRVDGNMVGDVVAKANAAVGPQGHLEGTLVARSVSVAGRVKGTVSAAEKLILEGKSVVHGDIRAAKLVVDEGAIFDGRCAMTAQAGSETSSPPRKA